MAGIGDVQDILRGAKALLFGFGGRMVARIVLIVIASRQFGPAEFGILGQTAALTEVAAALGVLGLRRSLLDMLSYNAENGISIEQRIAEAIIVVMAVSVAISLGLLFYWSYFFPQQSSLLPLLFIAVPAIAFTEVALTAIKYKRIVKWDVWSRGFTEPWGFLALTLLLLGMGIIEGGLVIAYVGSVCIAAVTVLIGLIRCYGIMPLLRSKPSLRNCLRIPKKSIPVGITDMGVLMLRRIDVLVLAMFVPAASVGLYYMVQQLATVPQKVSALFEPMISPVIARLHNRFEAGRIRANLIGACRWVFIIQLAMTIPMVVYGDRLLFLFNPVFVTGGLVLALVLIAEVIDGTFITTETPLVFSNPGIPPILLVITLAIETILIALFSKLWGVEGAAIGFLIALSSLALGRVWMLNKKLQIIVINSTYILPILFGAMMAAGLTFARLSLDSDNVSMTAVIVLFSLICYSFLIRKFAMTKSDKVLLRAVRQRRRRSNN